MIHTVYEEITKELIKGHLSVTTMESCTSGLIASLLTDTEGASAIFKGAYITYSNEAKIAAGVSQDVINKYGVYSEETAIEMAKVAKEKMQAYISIGVTGSFGNVDPNNADSVPGEVFVAIAIEESMHVEKINIQPELSRREAKEEVAFYVGEKLGQLLSL